MFRKKFLQPNRIISEEGFAISFGHLSAYYTDELGKFQFSFEDGLLIPKPCQVSGAPVSFSLSEMEEMTERVAAGIKFDDRSVQIFRKTDD